MSLDLNTAATEKPLLLEEVKDHLRLDSTDEDAYLESLISAAVATYEDQARVSLCTQTWDLYLDDWPGGNRIKLPRPPLASVTGVYYTPNGGSETELDSTNYHVDTVSKPGSVVLGYSKYWPTDTLQTSNAIRVEYVAGKARSAIGDDTKAALLLLVGHWYQHREVVTESKIMEVPQAYAALLWKDRSW